MPYQVGVTIRAEVAADQLRPLRKWLADIGRNGLAEPPFDFAHLRGLHFARFYLLEETTDLDGRPIPASLVLHERGGRAAAPPPGRAHRRGRRRHRPGLRALCGLSGPGGSAPGPRSAWLRRHLVRASAFYVNTVGRGLDQIRQEARLRDALEDYLDQRDWAGRARR